MTNGADPTQRRPSAALLRLVVLATGAALVTLAAGYYPTCLVAKADGAGAMCLGVGIAWIASLAGLVPTALTLSLGPRQRMNGMLAGMAIRFVLVITLLLTALLADLARRAPLALWTAIGYIILLAVDTVGVARLTRPAARTPS